MATRRSDKYAAVKEAEKSKGTNPFAKANANLTKTSTANKKEEENKSNTMEDTATEEIPTTQTIEEPKKDSNKKKEDEKIVIVEEIPADNLNLPSSITNLFGTPKKKRTGKSRSIYLYDDNMEKLEQIASMQGLSASKVLNEILDNIFKHQ